MIRFDPVGIVPTFISSAFITSRFLLALDSALAFSHCIFLSMSISPPSHWSLLHSFMGYGHPFTTLEIFHACSITHAPIHVSFISVQVFALYNPTPLKYKFEFSNYPQGANLSIIHCGASGADTSLLRYLTLSCSLLGFPVQNSSSLKASVTLLNR